MKTIWIKCENNVKLRNHIIFICFSYYFHIIFTFWSPEPGPRPGSRAPKCENNVEIIYENNVILQFHIVFTFLILFAYFYHIFGLGTQIRGAKIIFLTYSWSFFFHIIFIFLWKPSFPACPYGQSLQPQCIQVNPSESKWDEVQPGWE